MMDHKEYLKRRDELSAIRNDSFEAFDKSIVTLSTGCLALSVAFLDKIGMPFDKTTFFLISASWVAFLMVILLNLASYMFAKRNMDKKIHELDSKYRKQLNSEESDDSSETIYWQRKATEFCNNGAFIVFCIGVVTVMAYVWLIQKNNYSVIRDIKKETTVMSENKSTPLNKGKTETPKAVTKPVGPSKIVTHGKTETPQPVIKPTTPKEKR